MKYYLQDKIVNASPVINDVLNNILNNKRYFFATMGPDIYYIKLSICRYIISLYKKDKSSYNMNSYLSIRDIYPNFKIYILED